VRRRITVTTRAVTWGDRIVRTLFVSLFWKAAISSVRGMVSAY